MKINLLITSFIFLFITQNVLTEKVKLKVNNRKTGKADTIDVPHPKRGTKKEKLDFVVHGDNRMKELKLRYIREAKGEDKKKMCAGLTRKMQGYYSGKYYNSRMTQERFYTSFTLSLVAVGKCREALPVFVKMVIDKNVHYELRQKVLHSLSVMRATDKLPLIRKLVLDENMAVAMSASSACYHMKDKSCLTNMKKLLGKDELQNDKIWYQRLKGDIQDLSQN